MSSHGRAIAADHLVLLVADAVEHSAATMYQDATTRLPDDGWATQDEMNELIAAALAGTAEAFAYGSRLTGD